MCMLAHVLAFGEMSLFDNIGPAAGVCLHCLCLGFSLSLDRRPWIFEAQYFSSIEWDGAILLSLMLFWYLLVHHGFPACWLQLSAPTLGGGSHSSLPEAPAGRMLVDGTRKS